MNKKHEYFQTTICLEIETHHWLHLDLNLCRFYYRYKG